MPDQNSSASTRPAETSRFRPALPHREKLVPMVVALPLFLQNVDTSVMGTALPTISDSLHVDALRLNLAITAYLISLAIFLPASGWIADRFGAKRVFCAAITVFSIASGLCGLTTSLELLVFFRVLQGLGGAMMVPVGRLILVRTVPAGAMVAAMAWFTVPPAVGRMLGPLLGGAVVTWVSWRWIFLVNIPIGILGILFACILLDDDEVAQARTRFDVRGFLLLGVGLASLLAAFEGNGFPLLEHASVTAFAAVGSMCLAGYWWHGRRVAEPLIDLRIMSFTTFFASTVGGFPLRLAIGAVPFLLPLLFQFAFALSPLDTGFLMAANAIGSLATRAFLSRAVRRAGFRPLLVAATLCSSLCYVVYANFTPQTSHALMFVIMLIGGLLMSMVLVALQTLAFSEVPAPLAGQATALSTMSQQLSFSLGVVVAVEVLRVSVWWRVGSPNELRVQDFSLAFYVLAAIVLSALPFLVRLPPEVGAEFRDGPP